MNPILIGRKRLSDIVWGLIDEKVEVDWQKISAIVDSQQYLRHMADYNTGSLREEDAGSLYKIVAFFKPRVIAEVGTFIGVSTLSMYEACKGEVDIYTCDFSNAIKIDAPTVKQYMKTPSHVMFKDMVEKGIKADLVYLDGRLGNDDVEPLSKVIHDNTVFVFDDFEGVEKGVVNAMMVENFSRALIYPSTSSRTAFSVPFSLLQLVPQEAT